MRRERVEGVARSNAAETVLTSCGVGEPVDGCRTRNLPLCGRERRAASRLVLAHERTRLFERRRKPYRQVSRDGEAAGGLADDHRLETDREAVPVVDRGHDALLEAEVLDAPVDVRDHTLSGPTQSLPRLGG